MMLQLHKSDEVPKNRCYHCVEVAKFSKFMKFYDHWRKHNEVMMEKYHDQENP